MSTRMFPKSKQNFIDKLIDWDTDTIKSHLIDLTVADTSVKAVTGATNATPIALTVTGHGWSVGDIIVTGNIGGNLSGNGTVKIKGVTDANTITIQTTTPEALDVVGSGVYTSGGYAINLTQANNYQDINAGEKAVSATLTTKTKTDGIFDCDDPAFTAVTNGTVSHCCVTAMNTGTPSTDKVIHFNDGKHQVIVNTTAAASATAISVEPLEAAIPNGTVLVFSNGASATLTSQPAQFARSLAVSALAAQIVAGHTADAPSTASPNFPISGNGGNITLTVDNAANKLCVI